MRAQLTTRARLEERGQADLHLVVDGVRVEPRVRGLATRFIVPAGAEVVWLVSSITIPAEITVGSPDRRSLGVCVGGLTIDDGFGEPRHLPIDDPCLDAGFHAVERDEDATWRWTAGRARLPKSLREKIVDDVFLRVDLAGLAWPRWIAPAARVDEVTLPSLG